MRYDHCLLSKKANFMCLLERQGLYVRYTHYYNSNVIWPAVSCRVDEVIPSAHPRREALRPRSDGMTSPTRCDTGRQITLLL